MWKGEEGGRKRLFDIGKYILTGLRTGVKGHYNSFAPLYDGEPGYYRGFTERIGLPTGNDVIDAYLYNKRIDPEFGLYLSSIGEDFAGFDDYLSRLYSGKMKDVPVYVTEKNDPFRLDYAKSETGKMPKVRTSRKTELHPKIEQAESIEDAPIATETGYEYDSGGHWKEFSSEGSRERDIWKFEPEAYNKKWIQENKYTEPTTNWFENWLIKQGLKTVDHYGTPIIVRSKWKHKAIDEYPDYWD